MDSYRNPDSVSNIIVPITNVMNDQCCYQISKKIRQVFDMKRTTVSLSVRVPPTITLKARRTNILYWLIPETAEVVKNIFSMFLSEKNKRGITRYFYI